MNAKSTGFTLVELVVVLLIGGILAVTALPKFFTADAETVLAQRDQLLSLSRQIQLQSMQDTASLSSLCPTLVITSTAAGPASSDPCLPSAGFSFDANNPQQIDLSQAGVTVSIGVLPLLLRFDSWGRPQGSCAGGCQIDLTRAGQQASFCIAASGYQSSC
ncbi:prepilin-type N-terminal cleavage/methylation domain-containing protein [Rheinheimera sp.]|uniref:prepilin-type N-terminal cleavage/methylation domain-containing protein n=1 Tax=Rheinheimera sp. TaxID=1869214 RepID=UPI002FDED73F